MKVSNISNFNFSKSPRKSLSINKQTIKIISPESKPDPEKILVVMSKNQIPLYQGLNLQNNTQQPTVMNEE